MMSNKCFQPTSSSPLRVTKAAAEAERYASKKRTMAKIESHFKREAKLMFLLPLAMIILAIIASIFGPWLLREFKIDRCLDNGGKFDYEKNICLGNASQNE